MTLDDLLSNPLWIPASIGFDHLIFEEISPDTLKSSPFLDSRAVGKTEREMSIPLTDLFDCHERILASCGPVYEIFHISHVGSTFLARLMDGFPGTTVYREPPVLKGLASLYRVYRDGLSIFDADSLTRLHAIIYCLMSGAGTKTIIKHSSQNLVLPRALELYDIPVKQSLYIYTDCHRFLAHGAISQGLTLDALNGGRNRILFLNSIVTLDRFEISYLNTMQKIALIWMAEMVKLLSRVADNSGDTLFHFDQEMATKSRKNILNGLAMHFDIKISSYDPDALSNSPIWDVSSKSNQKDSFANRQEKIKASSAKFEDEIQQTIEWVRRLCLQNMALYPLLRYL